MENLKYLAPSEKETLFNTLRNRFNKNLHRHEGLDWAKVLIKLEANHGKCVSLFGMENTGGEPDVIGFDTNTEEYIFMDCCTESPAGRRSVCYDREALDTRKEFKPDNNALDMAASLGISILTEEEYRTLQKFGNFDTKSSSWVKTPMEIRILGGALFGDYRYGSVFIYHNGAQSYYAARGFRGTLRV
jgi:hypothetical protein